MDNARVLLADRRRSFVRALESLLAAQPGLQVVAAVDSPDAARTAITATGPHVVVVGDDLEPLGGLVEELAGASRGPAVVVVGPGDTSETAMSAMSVGASAYVPRTGNVQDLVDAIRAVLRGELWFPATMLAAVVQSTRTATQNQPSGGVTSLTEREREILQLLTDGLNAFSIAERLHLSTATVRTHIASVRTKLGVGTSMEAVAEAIRAGLRPAGSDTT